MFIIINGGKKKKTSVPFVTVCSLLIFKTNRMNIWNSSSMSFKRNKQSVFLEMKNLSGHTVWGEENKARNLHQKQDSKKGTHKLLQTYSLV